MMSLIGQTIQIAFVFAVWAKIYLPLAVVISLMMVWAYDWRI